MVVLAIILVLFLGYQVYDFIATRPIAFNSELWKRGEWDKDRSPRWRMREDLKRVIRPGMTIEEVERLLGPPESGRFDDYYYYLGYMGPWFETDPRLLVVTYVDGRVTTVRLP